MDDLIDSTLHQEHPLHPHPEGNDHLAEISKKGYNYLKEGVLEEAEKAIWEELALLTEGSIVENELEKVKNKFESTQIFGNINYLNVATNLAWYELLGRAEDMEKEVDRYRSVTAEQLRAVAQSAFRKENGVILYYKKQQN